MIDKATIFYQQLSFDEFVGKYAQHLPNTRLFELSVPWLSATKSLVSSSNKQVVVHCLFEGKLEKAPHILIAWPLVHITEKSSTKKRDSVVIQLLFNYYGTVIF
jgi:hypothetical protein